MQPHAIDIKALALTDPVTAYGILLGVPRAPISFNSIASFSSFGLSQAAIEVGLDQTVSFRTWIDNVTYDLQCPGLFAGNVFQAGFLADLKQSPGVSVRVTVFGGPKYLVSQTFTPLQNFVNLFASRWPGGWPLYPQQNIQTEFMLTQVPSGDDTGLSAYNVTLSWNGWQFLDPCMDTITGDYAREKLVQAGIEVSKLCDVVVGRR